MKSETIKIFPLDSGMLGMRADWFELVSSKLIDPAYLLLVLFLIIFVGVAVLKRFEEVNLTKKLWNIPIIIIAIGFWPFLVIGLKDLVDVFNTFLVEDIFGISWKGFGFPQMGSWTNFFGWGAEALARLLPNLAYWVIYTFFMVFFFLISALGPLVLAKGVLMDEITMILDLIKELVVLYLWQTMLLIVVAFVMPEIVSGEPFPNDPPANFYFLSLILSITILFVPMIAKKFGNHMGSPLIPFGAFWDQAVLLTMASVGKVGALGISAAGFRPPHAGHLFHYGHRAMHVAEHLKAESEIAKKESENKHLVHSLESAQFHNQHYHHSNDHSDHESQSEKEHEDKFLHNSKRAFSELYSDQKEGF